MNKPLDNFNLHIIEFKKLDDVYKYNKKVLTEGIDISGLLRAEIVFAVSALDQYVHSVVLFQVIDFPKTGKPGSKSFSKLLLGLDSVQIILNNDETTDVFPLIEQQLKQNLGWRSFQQPDKIAEALKIVCDKKIWDEVSSLTGKDAKLLKEQLQLIVKRRDSIAHEADFDIVNQCQYPINRKETIVALNFIISLVYMIDAVVFDYAYNESITNEKLMAS